VSTILLGLTGLGLTGLLAPMAHAGAVHALLIGVGDYPESSGWADLHAGADVALMADTLGALGADHIHRLEGRAATREGIVAAIEERLRVPAEAGDHLLLHYSGHGQQLADDDGDEADGLDEGLAVWGAPRRGDADYDGAAHLRDDELGALLESLRETVGPAGSVTVVLDACHSGTATRGGLPVRGGAPPIGAARPTAHAAGGAFGQEIIQPLADAERAPLVVLSAARADQVAREVYGPDGQPMGALTLALARSLSALPRDGTWRSLHARVRAEMAQLVRGQSPQIEGDADRVVFSADSRQAALGFDVAAVVSRDEIRVAVGTLHGLAPGSLIALVPPDAPDAHPSRHLARATVTESAATTSVAVLAPDSADAETLLGARAVVVAWARSPASLRVQIDTGSRGHDKAWRAALGGISLIEITDERPDVVLELRDGALELADASDLDRVLASGPADAEPTGSELLAAISGQARGRLIGGLSLDGERHRVDLRLLPADRGADGLCRPSGAESADDEQVFHPGDSFLLEVQSQGEASSWLTFVYTDPLGAPSQLWPQEGLSPDRLAPGQRWLLPFCATVSPPFGVEQIKLFATRNPVDLGPVLGHAKAATRGAGDGADTLQILLDEAAQGTRGGESALEDGYTDEVIYSIRPR